MEKKITKREVLTAMLQIKEIQANADFVNYIENELQLLAKKSENRKSAKTNEENIKLAEVVLEVLKGSEGMTASDIIRTNEELSGLSTPKMTALLKVLMEQGKVVRIEDKKKVLFKAVEVAQSTSPQRGESMDKEKQIQKYMVSLGISREDAEQLWEDDQADFIGEEGEEMTQKAKQIRRYEQSAEPRKKTERQVKLDEEKVQILAWIEGALVGRHSIIEENEWDFENITVANPQKEITFTVGGNEYSISLIKHRKKEV